MTSESRPSLPRIGLALPDGELRRKVLRSLRDAQVEVEEVPQGAEIWGHFDEQECDVIVIRRNQLDPERLERIRAAAQADEGPSVVVLSEGEDPHERTDLLVSGAARVLDSASGASELGVALEAVASVESDGGSAGPERSDPGAEPRLADFLSRSAYMKRFLDVVARVADATAPLFITGETGVGKERLARAIHAESSRSERPFVAVNCAALPEQLLESELFGHEKGSFTGADARRTGRFEQAAGGTIFLDEIGEMPTHMQVKLLNVLQRGEVQRIGAAAPIRVDARVMAATNRDVTSAVEAGTFRADLYYRLNVVPLEIPALRERREDIPDLVGSLIQALHQDSPDSAVEGIAEDALQALMAYAWPGNVRELINVIERGMLLARGPRIELADLPEQIAGLTAAALPGSPGSAAARSPVPELPQGWRDLGIKEVRQWAIDRVERAYLTAVLTETSGVVAETARRAGISPRALYDRMRRHELDKDDFKP